MTSEYIKEQENCRGGIPDSTHIEKLIVLCSISGLPYEVGEHMGRPMVYFPDKEHRISDAVCHFGSYGHQEGLIEIMGLHHNELDGVDGWLTAAEVFCRWYTYWKENMKEE